MPVSKKDPEAEVEVKFYDAADRSAAPQTTAISAKYSAKETVNLCMKDKKDISLGVFCLLLAIVLAVIVLLEFFFAYLPYRDLENAEAALAKEQAEYQTLVDSMKDYDEVRDNYRKYNYENFDRTVVDREEILDMLEEVVFSMGKVQSIDIKPKQGDQPQTLTITVSEVLRTNITSLQTNLRAHALVKSVEMTKTVIVEDLATMTLRIELKDAEGGN